VIKKEEITADDQSEREPPPSEVRRQGSSPCIRLFKKAVRTLQSEFPALKEAKDLFYYYMRRTLAVPHEQDFKALRFLAPSRHACFVDVGANQGQSIESILLAWPEGNIVSFEANPSLAEKLARRYEKRQNVRVIAKGLSDSSGTFILFVPSYKGFVYDGLASFDRKAAMSFISEKTVFGFDRDKLTISEVQCIVDTLDAQSLSPTLSRSMSRDVNTTF
jgi:FkbM family methyltransferase